VLNPRDSECRSQARPTSGGGRSAKASPPQSSNQPVQPNPTSEPLNKTTKEAEALPATQAKPQQDSQGLHTSLLDPSLLVHNDLNSLEPREGQSDTIGNIDESEEKRQSPIVTADESSSQYEEQSFRSVASIRLSQLPVLPPYKRERLPDGEALPAVALTAEDDDLTYERLGRQFRDLTAKVRIKCY